MLISVVRFDLPFCNGLQSGHLEQLAISCPNIQQLNLQYSHDCLRRLQGLQAIVTHCSNLQGLNILGITWVENQVELWQILKLIHLVVDLCVVEAIDVMDLQTDRVVPEICERKSIVVLFYLYFISLWDIEIKVGWLLAFHFWNSA